MQWLRISGSRPGLGQSSGRCLHAWRHCIIHDVVMLNALAGTQAARAAMTLAIATLRQAFG